MTESTPSKPSSLLKCLEDLQVELNKNQKIASLWKDWPSIAGEQLSPHCTPLSLYKGVLIIGANHPQWIQALVFNKNQLLAALKAKGHLVKDLKIKNYFQQNNLPIQAEFDEWEKHPSRIDVHGLSKCKLCKVPAPSGELSLWGKCGFCRRKELAQHPVNY